MIDFSFTKEQEEFREKVREFAQKEVEPRRKEWDREGKSALPINERLAAWGLLTADMDNITRGILTEEVAYVDFNSAMPLVWATMPFVLHQLPGVPEEVKKPIQEGILSGKSFLALCFAESGAGTDMAGIKTSAVRDDEGWVINGTKNTISWVNADYYFVCAKTGDEEEGIWALTNFLVPASFPGVSKPKIWKDMGSKGAVRGTVNFTNVRVPLNYMIGEMGKGYLLAAEFFDTNRAFIGLKCIGAAQASVDESCLYAKKRGVMGKPIAGYQAISFPLAEAQTLLEAARLLCYKTLWMADKGVRHTTEGAMCKWWIPEITFEIVRKGLLTHGQYGYTEELPFEQRLRDILGWQIGDGTAEPSKLLIARSMMGKEYVG
ncbi:MAG: acyl-CoA dehydrogenase [Thermodesulfobacteriota bacterium]|nr:acyl-CoA dehydrogenase [Thermodesulfobacteriota bacterium]